MNQLDRDQLGSGYWQLSRACIPVPDFLNWIGAEAGEIEQVYRHLLAAWRMRPEGERVLLPDTIEAEHRRQPIVSLRDLHAAAARIAAPGYDLAQARAVADGRMQAKREKELVETARQQAWWSQTIEARRELERAAKNLPKGREENIALMRATLRKIDEPKQGKTDE